MSDRVAVMLEAFPDWENALVMDGFDDCIIGVTYYSGQCLVVYDYDEIIETLVSQGMSHDEALEYYEFNIGCAWIGPGTPIVMETLKLEGEHEEQ